MLLIDSMFSLKDSQSISIKNYIAQFLILILFLIIPLVSFSQTCKSLLDEISLEQELTEDYLYETFELLEDSMGQLSQDMALDLHLEAVEHEFKSQGVEYERRNDVIVILSGAAMNKHPFNEYARLLEADFNTALIYDPLLMILSKSHAFLIDSKSFMVPVAVGLSLDAVYQGVLGSNEAHEKIHVLRSSYRMGLVNKGYVSDAIIKDRVTSAGDSGYVYLSVEEIEAFFASYKSIFEEAVQLSLPEEDVADLFNNELSMVHLVSKDLKIGFKEALKVFKKDNKSFSLRGSRLFSSNITISKVPRNSGMSHFRVTVSTDIGDVIVFTRRPLKFNKRIKALLSPDYEDTLGDILMQVKRHLKEVISYGVQMEQVTSDLRVLSYDEAKDAVVKIETVLQKFF